MCTIFGETIKRLGLLHEFLEIFKNMIERYDLTLNHTLKYNHVFSPHDKLSNGLLYPTHL